MISVLNHLAKRMLGLSLVWILLLPNAYALSWLDDSRVAFDTAVRVAHNTETHNTDTFVFTGIDSHRVFSNQSGDIGTLLIQAYAMTLQDVEKHPPIFADEDDTELTYRNVYFNYTGMGRGLLNFKIGHFEVPFGIEQVITTNGELRDFQHKSNLGVKADWGVSLNGGTRAMEYEVSWQRGSGNEWETQGNPGLIAGRIGTSRQRAWAVGLSFFDGDVFRYSNPDQPIERQRIGIDARFAWRRFEMVAEISQGEDFDQDVLHAMAEFSLYSANTNWFAYSQIRHQQKDGITSTDHANSLAVGLKYEPDNHWALSADYAYQLDGFGHAPTNKVIRAQLRYRFQ